MGVSVVTLIRKEIARHIVPLDVKSNSLQGRILAFHYTAEGGKGIVFANVWMPHTGFPSTTIREAYEDLTTLTAGWRSLGEVVIAGDWNAALTRTQRSHAEPRGIPHIADAELRDYSSRMRLTEPEGDEAHTWISYSRPEISGRIDHFLVSSRIKTTAAQTSDLLYKLSDHTPITLELHHSHGVWLKARRTAPPWSGRIKVDQIEELSDIFSAELEATRNCRETWSLADVESQLKATAEHILGVTSSRRSKLHRDEESRNIQDLINGTTRWMRSARKLSKQQLAFFPLPEGLSSIPDLQLIQQLLQQGNMSVAEDKYHEWLSQLRHRWRDRLRLLRREHLKACINRKRLGLGQVKGSIQRAMGKASAQDQLSELCSSHPDIISIPCSQDEYPALNAICRRVDEHCTTILSTNTLDCTVSKLDAVSAILKALDGSPLAGSITLKTTHRTVTETEDILATLEHHMGMEGMAREIECSQCRTHTGLTCLSSSTSTGRSTCTFCSQCNNLRETVRNPAVYDNVPWGEECFTQHRRVPQHFPYRLADPLSLPEVKRAISRMKNRKAPGMNGVGAELWKHAPDWMVEELRKQINSVLEGGPMPPEWRGGIVHLLFKKHPSNKISNWRPICMAETSYRIFSSIVATRLQTVAEKSGILEHTQEGFRPLHGTRRQIERLLSILRKSKLARVPVIAVFLDFCNAFNSIDITAAIKILKSFGIPDIHVIEEMYRDAHFIVQGPDGTTTARIPLTRGTKQGDPASPIIFNIVINVLLRMIALSGRALEVDNKKYNCAGFADDMTLMSHTTVDANYILNNPVKDWCSWSGMKVNASKSIATGLDYRTNTPINTETICFNGEPLISVGPAEAVKYLGAHLQLNLEWHVEKRYIIDKMKRAIAHLEGTCFTASQITSLIEMCVRPIFRYSAPFVNWSHKELADIDRLLARGLKHAHKLPTSASVAPFLMPSSQGGQGLTASSYSMFKELRSHFTQCLRHDDEVASLTRDRALHTLRSTGATGGSSLRQLLYIPEVLSTLQGSILGRIQALVGQDAWPDVDWWSLERPIGPTLCEVVREKGDQREQWRADILVGTDHEEKTAIKTIQTFHKAEAALIPLLDAGFSTVKSLRANHGRGVRQFSTLPPLILQRLRESDYKTLCRLLEGHREARIELGMDNSHTSVRHLLERLQAAPERLPPPEGQYEGYDCVEEAYHDLIDWEWDRGDGEYPVWGQDDHLGEPITWSSGPKGRGRSLGEGVIVAVRRRGSVIHYRVVFWNGWTVVLDEPQRAEGEEKYLNAEHKFLTQKQNTQEETRWYAHKWEQTAKRKQQYQILESRRRFDNKDRCYAVICLGGQPESAPNVYRVEESRPGLFHLWKQNRVGKYFRDADEEEVTLFPDVGLGRYSVLQYNTLKGLDPEEQKRLDEWTGKLTKARPQRETQPQPSSKSSLLGYFSRQVTPAKTLAITCPESEPNLNIPKTSEWCGRSLSGEVLFDWTSMTPTFQAADGHLAVQLGGSTTFYRLPEPLTGEGRVNRHWSKKFKKSKVLGRVDNRTLYAVLALTGGNLTDHLISISRELSCENPPRNLHWRLIEVLRNLQNASTYVGTSILHSPPGFKQLYTHHTNDNLLNLGFCTGLQPRHTTVTWIGGLPDQHQEEWLNTQATSLSSGIIITPMRWEETLNNITGFRKLISLPKGTALMAHKQHNVMFAAKSQEPLSIWVKGALTQEDSRVCTQILEATSPDAATSLAHLYECEGGRWTHFHSAAQEFAHLNNTGILVATDGSVQVVEDGNGGKEVKLGAALAFRRGDRPEGNIARIVDGASLKKSSFLAEGGAIQTALDTVQPHIPLTILTDSANIMYAMQHRSRNDWWRDFDSHRDRDMLNQMAVTLASRTAKTVFVKIKAHTSVPLNETADQLADAVCNGLGIGDKYQHLPPMEYVQQESANTIRIQCLEPQHTEREDQTEFAVSDKSDKQISEFFIDRRNTFALAKKTISRDRLRYKGCGRDAFGKALWCGSLTDTNIKRVLQVLGDFFPTQQYLHRIGAATNPNCPYCDEHVDESIQHWQATCTTFHDARTKVHNNIWRHTWQAIIDGLDKNDWTPMFETTISDADIPFTEPNHATRKPDGILLNRKENQWILLDFTRGSGNSVEELQRSIDFKRSKYNDLVSDILHTNGQNSVEFYPLVTSYSGAIHEEAWKQALVQTKILTDAQLCKLLVVVAHQLCLGIDTMASTRARAERRDVPSHNSLSQSDNCSRKHRGNWFSDVPRDPDIDAP
jgi:ribonuclease HI